MRLIDADVELKEAKELSGPQTGDGWDNWGVYALIERQPTIDAVPVVRCGNCAKRGKNGKGVPGGCPFGMTDDTCDSNAYCSYGVLSL